MPSSPASSDPSRPYMPGQAPRSPGWGSRVAAPIFIGLAAAGSAGFLRDHLPAIARSASAQVADRPAASDRPALPQEVGAVGVVEALPKNVYHATPYNDWPLFEIKVREGQRLRFVRENNEWKGDRTALFVQFETPAEIDTKQEEVEVADREKAAAEHARDVLRIELGKELEAAEIRERNARQQFQRTERLHQSNAATQEDLQRARNVLDLAATAKEQAAALLDKKVQQATNQVDLAEHRLRLARAELTLTDFKREMSWGSVPVARGQFEEVVVTKIRGVRGDVPTASSRKETWVEVIDDRVLNVRVQLTAAETHKLADDQPAVVRQDGRDYEGRISGIGAVADAETQLVPILIEVKNTDRKLKINTKASVQIGQP